MAEIDIEKVAEAACKETVAMLKELDIVPVTRCKDCRFFKIAYDNVTICNRNRIWDVFVNADDFCSFAEKTDNKGLDKPYTT